MKIAGGSGISQISNSQTQVLIEDNLHNKSNSLNSNTYHIDFPDIGKINLAKDVSMPILTTLLGLIIWQVLRRLIIRLSEPTLDIYFVDKGVKKDTISVPIGSGFNLPIYILAKRKINKSPFMWLVAEKSWKVLVNIIADPSLDIYSLDGRLPTNKYSMGEHVLYEGSPQPLGPASFGAGAKLNNPTLPMEIEVRVFLDRRDVPFAVKKLTLVK